YHSLTAEQFMTCPAAYIAKDSTYGELQDLIYGMSHVRAFPLVENKKSMSLVGSISRSHLFKLLQANVGVKARQAEATERIRRVIDEVSERYCAPGDAKGNGKIPMGQKRHTKRFIVESVRGSTKSLGQCLENSSVPPERTPEKNLLAVPTLPYVPRGSVDGKRSAILETASIGE
ncbi:hypothetical protein ANCDUO_15860, partial [Ancylostoma duodenale]